MKFKYLIQQNNINNSDDDLYISGVASDNTRNLDGRTISEQALVSMVDQAKGLNLHKDHGLGFDDVIGVITEAFLDNDKQLQIKARVLPEFKEELLNRLNFGVKYGFSIHGIAKTNEYNLVESINLLEISLTPFPANWETMGTVSIDNGTVLSNSLELICQNLNNDNMSENNEEIVSKGLNEAQVNQVIQIMNEGLAQLKEEILAELQNKEEEVEESIKEDPIQQTIKQSLKENLDPFKEAVKNEVLQDLEKHRDPRPKFELKQSIQEKEKTRSFDDWVNNMINRREEI